MEHRIFSRSYDMIQNSHPSTQNIASTTPSPVWTLLKNSHLRSTGGAQLLHDEPTLQALRVEAVRAGQDDGRRRAGGRRQRPGHPRFLGLLFAAASVFLAGLPALVGRLLPSFFGLLALLRAQIVPTNDAGLRVFYFRRTRQSKFVVEIVHDLSVLAEVAQTVRQLSRDLQNIRHHVDREPGGVLHEEDAHKTQKYEHRQTVADQIQVENVRRLARPAVLQRRVDDVQSVFAETHKNHGRHGERLEQNPGVEGGVSASCFREAGENDEINGEKRRHEHRQLHLDGKFRTPDLEHVRHADLRNQVKHLQENNRHDKLHQLHRRDLLLVDGRAVKHQKQNSVREEATPAVNQLFDLQFPEPAWGDEGVFSQQIFIWARRFVKKMSFQVRRATVVAFVIGTAALAAVVEDTDATLAGEYLQRVFSEVRSGSSSSGSLSHLVSCHILRSISFSDTGLLERAE